MRDFTVLSFMSYLCSFCLEAQTWSLISATMKASIFDSELMCSAGCYNGNVFIVD